MLPYYLPIPNKTREISMKLRQTFMLGATVALMACLGTVQIPAQGTRQRPFSDWLDKQTIQPTGCILVSWGDQVPSKTIATVDYAGKIGALVGSQGGPTIDTVVEGTVRERDLPDGRAEILLNVYFTNAMAFARDLTQPLVPTIFGLRTSDLSGHPELSPGLASGHLQARFIIAYPGAPLENLCRTGLLSLGFRANAAGPLRAAFGVPEGTPGKLVVSQTGLDVPGGGVGVADEFPAELIRVFQVGN
jgi:hypothetical protein